MILRVLTLVLLAATTPVLAQGGPAPRFMDPPMGVATAQASATTFWVRIFLRAPQGQTPDSLIAEARPTGASVVQHRLAGLRLRDSFALARPPAGDLPITVTGSACASYKRGVAVTSFVCLPYTYVEPAKPFIPPVIDSVKTDTLIVQLMMIPKPVTLAVGAAPTVCIFAVMGGGQVGYRGPRTQTCDAILLQAGSPPVKAVQQAKLDRTCFNTAVERTNVSTDSMYVTHTPACSGVTVWRAVSQ